MYEPVTRARNYVLNRGLALITLSIEESYSICHSLDGFNRFSLTRPFNESRDIHKDQLCLISALDYKTEELYLGYIKSKDRVSTTSHRLVILKATKLKSLYLSSLMYLVSDKRLMELFATDIDIRPYAKRISRKLSEYIFNILVAKYKNIVLSVFHSVDGFSTLTNGHRLQASTILDAMAIFGLRSYENPNSVAYLGNNTDSSLSILSNCPSYVLEDQIINHDARHIEGWNLIQSSITGIAEFQKGQERLTVFTANRGPIEEITGSDLIYINDYKRNIVMVQYKILERSKLSNSYEDDLDEWIFRPEKQFYKELRSMNNYSYTRSSDLDYRLCEDPFYFKFVRRIEKDLRSTGAVIAKEHLERILKSPESKGLRGGVRMSFNMLNGAYLRKQEFTNLIASGYIGTNSSDYSRTTELIRMTLNPEQRSSVIAYHR